MIASSAELAHAARSATLATLDARMVRSRAYPALRLGAGYGSAPNNFNRGATSRRATWGPDAGISLGFTIFDGSRGRAMRNARIEADNASLRAAEIETALRADLATFWQAYQNNLALLALEHENVLSARQNYEAARDLYMTGVMAGIELREAQMSLLAGEERLLVAQYNTKMCEISLMQISGRALEYLE
jgi:outer membrane protein TolC